MRIRALFIVLCTALPILADQQPLYLEYIRQYKSAALEQQRLHKIPASITMAQGLLESGAGKSELAVQANNHFGIKCTSDWKGETYRHDDETAQECFRKYHHAEESYEDHSHFLLRPRYKKLFALKLQDYKGWARGLKECGYATDPKYPEKLIKIIEEYDLMNMVADQPADLPAPSDSTDTIYPLDTVDLNEPEDFFDATKMEEVELYCNHRSGYQDGLHYIIAEGGESFESLSYYLNISEKMLRRYNDAEQGRELQKGDRVYLFFKHRRANRKHPTYYVRKGDTAWSISQKFGIRLKSLYELNGIPQDTPLTTRQKLRLR